MADFDVTIKNYRCFEDARPASIRIGKGLTALIGPNHVGKSALLRLFYELRNVWSWSRERVEYLSSGRNDAAKLSLLGLGDPSEVFCDANERGIELELRVGQPYSTPEAVPYMERIKLSCERGEVASSWVCEPSFNRSDEEVLADGSAMESILKDLHSAMYIGPFRNALSDGAGEYYDMAVGPSSVEAWRSWKTGDNKAKVRAIEAVTQDIREVFGLEKLEINASSDGRSFQVLLNGRPYKLRELGSGLAQFIVVLANAAMKRPSYIFIDEPEQGLHPGLQAHFLQKLAGYATEGVVFATNAIGLARLVADKVYSLQHRRGLIAVKSMADTPTYPQLAGELGFAMLRDAGYDHILLVEGVGEVRSFLHFLRLFGKERKVMLLPLGSLNLAKGAEEGLAELRRYAKSISVFADSERTSFSGAAVPERQELEDICKRLDIRVGLTALRGIENYFPDNAIKAELGPKYSTLGPFGSPKNGWVKANNWRIARHMTRSDLQGTDLGQFLEAL